MNPSPQIFEIDIVVVDSLEVDILVLDSDSSACNFHNFSDMYSSATDSQNPSNSPTGLVSSLSSSSSGSSSRTPSSDNLHINEASTSMQQLSNEFKAELNVYRSDLSFEEITRLLKEALFEKGIRFLSPLSDYLSIVPPRVFILFPLLPWPKVLAFPCIPSLRMS